MIHSCTNISIKDDEKTVAEGNDDGDVGAVESDEPQPDSEQDQ